MLRRHREDIKLNELKMNDIYDNVNFLINEKTSIENTQDFLNDLKTLNKSQNQKNAYLLIQN